MYNIKSLANTFDTTIEIEGDQYQQLKDLAKTSGITINTVLQFAWHKLIQIYTQDTQTVVGTTVSGRAIPVEGIEESVGMFINTLPLIINWDNDHTVLQQIQYIQEQITELNSHSFANLASMQEEGKRLFHSLFVFENYPMPEELDDIGKDRLRAELRYAVEKLDYPLGLVAFEQGNKLVIKLKSDRSILDTARANYNLEKVKLLLEGVVSNLDKKHNELSSLSQGEYQQIAIDWNQTAVFYPKDKTIHQLFEQQVIKTPDNIAVIFEENQLTYAELNAKANQLARYLQSQTAIKPDTLIALCLDRSLEMIIGVLGVMKAGGAYVPIDPEYPAERIQYILEDTQTRLVLTQSHLQENLEFTSSKTAEESNDVNIIILDADCYQEEETNNLPVSNKSTDLAYVIYTSGTTGRPKGVMISHKSVINLLLSMQNQYERSTKDTYLLKTNYSFDVSVVELFSCCFYGGTLVVLPTLEEKEPVKMLELVREGKSNSYKLCAINVFCLSR